MKLLYQILAAGTLAMLATGCKDETPNYGQTGGGSSETVGYVDLNGLSPQVLLDAEINQTPAQPTAAQASTDGQAVTKNSASAPAFSAPGWLKWLLIPLGLIVLFVLWFVLTCMYRARKVRRQRARIAQMRRQSHRRDEESR